jgi:hypothetical protein
MEQKVEKVSVRAGEPDVLGISWGYTWRGRGGIGS